jgi:hypothetical protein
LSTYTFYKTEISSKYGQVFVAQETRLGFFATNELSDVMLRKKEAEVLIKQI